MKLLTKENIKNLPKLYSQENIEDPVCSLKFFTPDSSFTFYILEGEPTGWKCSNCGEIMERYYKTAGVSGCYNCGKQDFERIGDDWLFFGKTVSHLCPEGELGYTLLSQLKEIKGPFGLGVERDMYFSPKPLSECK